MHKVFRLKLGNWFECFREKLNEPKTQPQAQGNTHTGDTYQNCAFQFGSNSNPADNPQAHISLSGAIEFVSKETGVDKSTVEYVLATAGDYYNKQQGQK